MKAKRILSGMVLAWCATTVFAAGAPAAQPNAANAAGDGRGHAANAPARPGAPGTSRASGEAAAGEDAAGQPAGNGGNRPRLQFNPQHRRPGK